MRLGIDQDNLFFSPSIIHVHVYVGKKSAGQILLHHVSQKIRFIGKTSRVKKIRLIIL